MNKSNPSIFGSNRDRETEIEIFFDPRSPTSEVYSVSFTESPVTAKILKNLFAPLLKQRSLRIELKLLYCEATAQSKTDLSILANVCRLKRSSEINGLAHACNLAAKMKPSLSREDHSYHSYSRLHFCWRHSWAGVYIR